MTHSDDPDYQTLAWHPEADRMRKLVEVWFDCNPQIRQRAQLGEDTDVSSSSCVANRSN